MPEKEERRESRTLHREGMEGLMKKRNRRRRVKVEEE
jgi:hypothetical protein